jgi:hypothetical protein
VKTKNTPKVYKCGHDWSIVVNDSYKIWYPCEEETPKFTVSDRYPQPSWVVDRIRKDELPKYFRDRLVKVHREDPHSHADYSGIDVGFVRLRSTGSNYPKILFKYIGDNPIVDTLNSGRVDFIGGIADWDRECLECGKTYRDCAVVSSDGRLTGEMKYPWVLVLG